MTHRRTRGQSLPALFEPQLFRRPGLGPHVDVDCGRTVAGQHPVQKSLTEQSVSRSDDLLLTPPQNLFDIRIFRLDRCPAQQIDLVDLEAQQAVQHLEAGERALGIPHSTQDIGHQDPEELAQALPVFARLIDQFTEARVDDPPDLPRYERRQRDRQLDDLFKVGPAALDVTVAERRRNPVYIVGEQVGNALKVRDRAHELRADRDLAVAQAVDLVDQDQNVGLAVLQFAGKLVPHAAEGVATGQTLPHRVETRRGGPPIAEPDAVGGGDAFAIFEYRLRQTLESFCLSATGLLWAGL